MLSGAELAALLSRLRGYAIAYKAPPKMMLRVFAPDYAKQVDLTDSKARAREEGGSSAARPPPPQHHPQPLWSRTMHSPAVVVLVNRPAHAFDVADAASRIALSTTRRDLEGARGTLPEDLPTGVSGGTGRHCSAAEIIFELGSGAQLRGLAPQMGVRQAGAHK